MAASSSGSSFTSSSLGRPPSYAQPYASPLDSTWTPTSGASTISALTSEASAPHASLRPLDLGPPGYQATITLFENTPNERTVYLGPWEVVGSEQRRVLWQCSYQSELLEHFLPSDIPADVFPHTLHSRHRPYTDPCELELYVSFREPHRVRYTTGEGMVMHDHVMEVKYEFTTVESSLRFQGDVRRKDLVDYYDIDVSSFSVMKIILAINAGSSSVKISVYAAEPRQPPRQLAETSVSGLTAPPAQISYTRADVVVKKDEKLQAKVATQDDAFKVLLKTLIDDPELSQIKGKDDIALTCHRIVHGGDYPCSQVITSDTYHHLEELSDLAPLHNGPALKIVNSCVEQLPDAVNVACFDTQFHSSIPEHVRTYPINQEIAKKNHLRKYGFHGISYSFITRSVSEFLGKDPKDINIIALHLGSGASACAIRNGQSWDTSMGLTPVAGLPGATRSGNVDPSLVFHYASDVGKLSPNSTSELHLTEAEEILNKQAGWKSLTGTTNFGTIATSDEPTHKLAFDIFIDRVCGFIGSYFVTLGGQVDALVFAGGIGEKSDKLRRQVVDQCACLGFTIDDELNGKKIESTVQEVGKPDGRSRTLVCKTDEQLEMARLCTEKSELWS
ncbi:putative acetate kinase [Colletotrichum sp. SAR 10_99]|nr:putative acetate kinase [Colletotrichum sp. SAR 10_98]KAJ5009533.1 putative acetate kinase [Colletotrichum sp. SAR 10_99]